MMPPKRGRSPALALDDAARVGDHGDRPALDVRVAADHLAREVGLELVEPAAIEQAGQHLPRMS